jgi:hypothetical protein
MNKLFFYAMGAFALIAFIGLGYQLIFCSINSKEAAGLLFEGTLFTIMFALLDPKGSERQKTTALLTLLSLSILVVIMVFIS